MNKIGLYAACMVCGLLTALDANAQVVFENGDFKEVLEKAKQEKKMIFMDCYTSWCGPCKKMENEVFCREDVGAFMNSRFVNYKKDMEKGEGKELAAAYEVKVYPTFLILNENGEVQHRMVGGMAAEKFLQSVEEGANGNSLNVFSARYRNGERGAEFINRYIEMLSAAYMRDELKQVLHGYWETLGDGEKCSAGNWPLVKRFVYDVKSPEYQYLLEHKADFEAVTGKENVNAKIFNDLHPLISNHCNSMIFKDRPEDSDALRNYRDLIKKSDVQRGDYLLSLVDFTQAYVDNELKKVLKMYRKEFSCLDNEDRLSATLWLNGMLIHKGDAKICREGLKAIRQTMKECGWGEDNPMFAAIIKGLQSKSA